ncbi:MAG TPA: methyltransferase domain-containing protein [Bradyrhizobium sp.]|nr:methyltransferase domain-containing protein [Bradyrhizobium sp.]
MNRPEQWHLTNDAAQRYEQCVAHYILGPWAPLLAATACIVPGERILDVACGTGVVTRIAAERAGPTGRVVGLDLNPGMIAVAETLSPPSGARIEWLTRSALDLGFGDASFDAVLCQQGLQFFPDKLIALREMRRALRPGGRLALSVWSNIGHYNSAVGKALEQFIGRDTAQRFCASRQAPSSDELLRLAIDAGFSDVQIDLARLDIQLPRLDQFALEHLAATPVASEVAAADAETRGMIGASVMHQLERYADTAGAVTYPEETYVLTAQRH